ncbi:hypothetical protein [Fuscibacter oryzae]|uniref:Anti-sigma factor n=1 Tax=Fuscibacter oryzae TaxID=2803939 RepID=A0A8J7MUZ9_9RHOB|nr:hypothetical protein [Fuscibacter oryzae]MBL4928349.1 hypothetical protein [Fuscibacter oryzae]
MTSNTAGMQEPVEQLLPFLVNGTLAGPDRARVEKGLRHDPALAAEAALLGQLRDAMKAMPQPASPAEFGLARLMRDIDREASAQRTRRWQLAGGAVAAAAIALAVMLVLPPGQTEYQQASGDPGRGDLTVAFVPGATLAEVTDLLQNNNLEIVDGPSAIGLYRLDVTAGANLDAIADKLRAMQSLVESVSLPE